MSQNTAQRLPIQQAESFAMHQQQQWHRSKPSLISETANPRSAVAGYESLLNRMVRLKSMEGEFFVLAWNLITSFNT
jgi:hypothetical protein